MRDNLPNMLRSAAKEWRKENKVVATGATRYDAALDEAADAIEELSAIREEQKAQIIAMVAEDKSRWIPVTERLPKTYEYVLLYVPNEAPFENVRFGHLMENGLWATGLYKWGAKNPVTHWMPLPEPPKEE